MEITLTKTRIRAGVWEGVLQAFGEQTFHPVIEVLHLEVALRDVRIEAAPDSKKRWHIQVPIPVELLSDGVQTFLIRDAKSGERLDSFTIITGAAMEEDIRAEVDLLRAELDMLKKAFRRHCLETMA